jgi:hypothetical protein
MFHMRNGTGLRNCTVSGLTGTLGSAGTGGGYGNNTTTQPAWWQTIPTGA